MLYMKKLFSFFLLILSGLFVLGQSTSSSPKGAILVDTHNDFFSKCVEQNLPFDAHLKGKTHSDLQRMLLGGVNVEIFSIFCDDHYGKGTAFAYANREIDSVYAVARRNPNKMTVVSSPAALLQAVQQHKLAAMMGVEGGHMIEDDLVKLDSFYKRGVRYMTLTWNNSTSWATSARDESAHAFITTPYGLTAFGKQIVKRMNDLGMMIDISHVGEQTFWNVIRTTSKPIIASHSSVYALCPVFRNLKDDQIKAIAKNGGVVQINFYSGFLDSNYEKRLKAFLNLHKNEYDSLKGKKLSDYSIDMFFSTKYHQDFQNLRPPLSLLIDHIDYIVKLVGVDYVGLGSDFDGIESAPKELDGVEDFPKIAQALLHKGYNRKDIERILGGNLIRVFKANSNK
jgi:membrane dipeptidase